MRLRAMRTLGVLALLALLTVPARTAGAATHHHKSSGKAHAKHAKHSGHGRRGHRHGPPPSGGVYARNAILIDSATGQVLFAKNAANSVPIASLTKLMTAMVFLEQKPDLAREMLTHNERNRRLTRDQIEMHKGRLARGEGSDVFLGRRELGVEERVILKILRAEGSRDLFEAEDETLGQLAQSSARGAAPSSSRFISPMKSATKRVRGFS